jgi:hypothetical protein
MWMKNARARQWVDCWAMQRRKPRSWRCERRPMDDWRIPAGDSSLGLITTNHLALAGRCPFADDRAFGVAPCSMVRDHSREAPQAATEPFGGWLRDGHCARRQGRTTSRRPKRTGRCAAGRKQHMSFIPFYMQLYGSTNCIPLNSCSRIRTTKGFDEPSNANSAE